MMHLMNGQPPAIANRQYKSTIFAMLFQEKKRLLELYNALNGTHYTDPDLLEVNTLENAIYLGMQNDLSFLIDSRMYLYEHQSTLNPNMPLRFLFYVTDLYSSLTRDANLYGTKRISIPQPRFLVFYNGRQKMPDRMTVKLSELYHKGEAPFELELEATILNINVGCNRELMDACKTLADYARYTQRVRDYAEEMPLNQAVERAVTECIREGILEEFLRENRSEVVHVSIYEYDAEKHIRQEKEESWEEGFQEGRESGFRDGKEAGFRDGQQKGRESLLIQLVKHKLEKGKTASEIAEDLEQEEPVIRELIGKLEHN